MQILSDTHFFVFWYICWEMSTQRQFDFYMGPDTKETDCTQNTLHVYVKFIRRDKHITSIKNLRPKVACSLSRGLQWNSMHSQIWWWTDDTLFYTWHTFPVRVTALMNRWHTFPVNLMNLFSGWIEHCSGWRSIFQAWWAWWTFLQNLMNLLSDDEPDEFSANQNSQQFLFKTQKLLGSSESSCLVELGTESSCRTDFSERFFWKSSYWWYFSLTDDTSLLLFRCDELQNFFRWTWWAWKFL